MAAMKRRVDQLHDLPVSELRGELITQCDEKLQGWVQCHQSDPVRRKEVPVHRLVLLHSMKCKLLEQHAQPVSPCETPRKVLKGRRSRSNSLCEVDVLSRKDRSEVDAAMDILMNVLSGCSESGDNAGNDGGSGTEGGSSVGKRVDLTAELSAMNLGSPLMDSPTASLLTSFSEESDADSRGTREETNPLSPETPPRSPASPASPSSGAKDSPATEASASKDACSDSCSSTSSVCTDLGNCDDDVIEFMMKQAFSSAHAKDVAKTLPSVDSLWVEQLDSMSSESESIAAGVSPSIIPSSSAPSSAGAFELECTPTTPTLTESQLDMLLSSLDL